MDFDGYISAGWQRHADEAAAVAASLGAEGLGLCVQAAQVLPLARLAHHVHGEHLGLWAEGIALQERIQLLPQADAAARAAVRRFITSLALAGQTAEPQALLQGLSAADATWATALAAAALAPHDAARAGGLLQDALARFEAARLPEGAPCTRALAVSSNNLAATLEERPQRSADEVALMLLAAQSARRFWALAGGWLETERAEYRLAHSWRAAGDAARARHHAQACLAIVAANGRVPLEHFFGLEALYLAEHAAGDLAARNHAAAQMRSTFPSLDADDQSWCQATLDKLPA